MWQLTRDNLMDRTAHVKSADWKPNITLSHAFRLLDDDGNLYFEGIGNDASSEDAFAPLDDYGEAFGCTEIRYFSHSTHRWEIL